MNKIETPVVKAFIVGDVRVDVNAILNCPFEDIREAAEKIPAYLGWFGHQRALAMERVINTDYRLKQAEARAYNDLKNNGKFVAMGFGEKVTESALERVVHLMPEVEQAQEKYRTAKKNFDWINGTIDALKAKFELVRSSEATRRMEHEPDKKRSTE